MKVREHPNDPIFVSYVEAPFVSLSQAADPPAQKIELWIGEPAGQSRHAILTPREAQRIALALLTLADASLSEDARVQSDAVQIRRRETGDKIVQRQFDYELLSARSWNELRDLLYRTDENGG